MSLFEYEGNYYNPEGIMAVRVDPTRVDLGGGFSDLHYAANIYYERGAVVPIAVCSLTSAKLWVEEFTTVLADYEEAGNSAPPQVTKVDGNMVEYNDLWYVEGEPGKCWVAEDHTTITDPEIIAMLEGALFQAILKGNDPAPTQGDQQ